MSSRKVAVPRLIGKFEQNWKSFKEQWVNFEIKVDLKVQLDKTERIKLFLKSLGPEGQKVYNGLTWANETEKEDIKKVILRIETYLKAKSAQNSQVQVENDKETMEGDQDEPEPEPWGPKMLEFLNTLNEDLKILNVPFEIKNETDYERMHKLPRIKVENTLNNPCETDLTTLTVLCWNIMGINTLVQVGHRAKCILEIIQDKQFDIILLQEVTNLLLAYFVENLKDQYQFTVQDTKMSYFHITMLKKSTVQYSGHKTIAFRNSSQGRSILQTDVLINDSVKLSIINVHLESFGDKLHSGYRKNQFEKCLKIGSALPRNCNVIFGGDLNMRDWEVKKTKIPKSMIDLWEYHGSDPMNCFTWDMSKNKNLEFPKTNRPKPKHRFDRLYFRGTSPIETLKPLSFDLTGLDKISADSDLFPSDHWGIVTKFDINKFEESTVEYNETFSEMSNFYRNSEKEENDNAKEEHVKENWDDSD